MSPRPRRAFRLRNAESREFAVWGRFLVALCFTLWVTPSAWAQGSTGSTINPGVSLQPIEGQVLAEGEQSPLQGVRVALTNFKGAGRSVAVTDHRGVFTFPNLPVGQYTLTFSHPNYKEQSQQVELFQGGQRDLQVFMLRSRGHENAHPDPAIGAWALQVPDRAQKLYSKGLEFLERGEGKQSIAHFHEATELYPRFAAAYAALGSAQLTLGDRKAAAGSFEKALHIDENLPGACLGLASIYALEQRYPEAEKQLLRAQMLKPEDWRVHYQLGEIYWRMGDWAKAEENLRRAVELHGKLPRIHLLLINALAGQEKYAELLAAMETFLKLFPDDRFAPQVAQKRDLLRAELAKQSTSKEKKQP
jgi:tetratricopeptide (TPR) repeat protein